MQQTEEIRARSIYVDIDSLFDTRLPLLYLISPDIGAKLSANGKYLKRVRDSFDSISYDIFRALYRKRNKLILKLATPTGLIKHVKQHYGDEVTSVEQLLSTSRPTIYINTYPYNLNTEEKNFFTFIIEKLIPKPYIEYLNVDNSMLEPTWFEEKEIGVIFKYDALDWIDYHISNCNLINKPLLTTTVIAPALLTGILKTSSVTKKTFDDMMVAIGTVIDLSFIDAIHFSTYIPDDTKK